MDDIVFKSTSPQQLKNFIDLMASEFEKNMIRELSYFLGF